MQVKKQELEPDMEQIDWFQIRKGVSQGRIFSPGLFNYYAECEMPGWMNHQLESRLPVEIPMTSNRHMIPL